MPPDRPEDCAGEGLPRPQLIVRIGGLGNRYFGRDNGIDEDPAALHQAAQAACDQVFDAVEQILSDILEEDRGRIFPHPDAFAHGWNAQAARFLGGLFGSRNRWNHSDRAGTSAAVFDRTKPPRITVLTGDASGGDRTSFGIWPSNDRGGNHCEWSTIRSGLSPRIPPRSWMDWVWGPCRRSSRSPQSRWMHANVRCLPRSRAPRRRPGRSLRGTGRWLNVFKEPEPIAFPGKRGTKKDYAACYQQVRERAAGQGLSGVHGDAHRGGIIASYLLAAVAVLLAVLGAIFHSSELPAGFVIVTAAVEVAVIVAMFALSSWIREQQGYHRRNRIKQEKLHHDIERFTTVLFVIVFGFALEHLVEAVFHRHGIPLAFPLLVCVGGPALIAALHGFSFQIEVERLRQRSSSMEKLLQERIDILESLDLSEPGNASAAWGLSREALNVAALMIDEAANWSMLYKPGIRTG